MDNINEQIFHDNQIFQRVLEHYKEQEDKYDIFACILQGSQNYQLDEYSFDYMSDVDTKMMILPSFEDFCLKRNEVSTTYVRANDEHTDIKDIRTMFVQFKKNNLSFLELLWSDYTIINPKYNRFWQYLIDIREQLINPIALAKAVYGMCLEKRKALTHPYPSIISKIEKYGFDPKQLHHIIRLYYLLNEFHYSNSIVFVPDKYTREKLMNIKKGYLPTDNSILMSIEQAEELADLYCNKVKAIADEIIAANQGFKYNPTELDDLLVMILKAKFREEVSS